MKKSQTGINAAVLVAIIAGLIILYILFLPSVEREELLEGEVKKSKAASEEENILLKEFPGRLDIIKDIEDKTIPNVFLFETTNAKELERINPFIVRSGWFDKKAREASFKIDDSENIDNVLLSFAAKKHKGILTIKLNGEVIFENEVLSETVEPIRLKRSLLKADNALEFSVSSVGIKFWSTNEYSLENVRVIGDLTDRSRQEALNVFSLKGEEFFNIEKATLKFVPYCKGIDVGVLEVSINSKNVFSAVPVCEDAYRQVVPTGVFEVGSNNIIFKTNRGSYSVEQIKLEFEAKETKTKVFFFEINETKLDEIEKENKDITLTIEFVNGDEEKRADININDHLLSLDQEDKFYSKNIKDKIREGNNFIEIRPRTELEIVEIRVEVED
ncbi:hypothetical protein J4458_06230 [Candidatus Woesearchaeota archaeon]|nr:hypothetical protein [Candidatus Woesearchaeota archaeon]